MSRLTRRDFLKVSGVLGATVGAQLALPTWMPRLAFAQPYNNPLGDVLIVVFLRGGADALNMVVPFGDVNYYSERQQLAIPRPDQANATERAINLDGFFGLHPALKPLLPIFENGHLCAIHAVGSPHDTRSHFEAMDFMERGTPGSYTTQTGWIARHLASLGTGEHVSPIRGIGWGTALPSSLVGTSNTVALQSIIDYHLGGDVQVGNAMMNTLVQLYSLGDNSLAMTAETTQAAVEIVASVGYANYIPQHSAQYPETEFGQALRQTSALIRADVGLEVACIDLGGWDTHANQGGVTGTQAQLMTQLAEGLQAFYQDMGMDINRVTVVVMSEFGRRLRENASRGTDHGRAGAMYVMNGELNNTPVVAQWPSLDEATLDNGDLAVTIDYRTVLLEILQKRLKSAHATTVFEGFSSPLLNLFA